jgi:hypothetical protein
MTTAEPLPQTPALLPCRHCGEAVAVQMASGRFRALGDWELSSEGDVVAYCPGCQRGNRYRRRWLVDRTRNSAPQ